MMSFISDRLVSADRGSSPPWILIPAEMETLRRVSSVQDVPENLHPAGRSAPVSAPRVVAGVVPALRASGSLHQTFVGVLFVDVCVISWIVCSESQAHD